MKTFLVSILLILAMSGTGFGFSLIEEPEQFSFTNFSLLYVGEGYHTTHNHPLEEKFYTDREAFDKCIRSNIDEYWSFPLTSSDMFILTAQACVPEADAITYRLKSYGWDTPDIAAYHYDILFYWTNVLDAHRPNIFLEKKG